MPVRSGRWRTLSAALDRSDRTSKANRVLKLVRSYLLSSFRMFFVRNLGYVWLTGTNLISNNFELLDCKPILT